MLFRKANALLAGPAHVGLVSRRTKAGQDDDSHLLVGKALDLRTQIKLTDVEVVQEAGKVTCQRSQRTCCVGGTRADERLNFCIVLTSPKSFSHDQFTLKVFQLNFDKHVPVYSACLVYDYS